MEKELPELMSIQETPPDTPVSQKTLMMLAGGILVIFIVLIFALWSILGQMPVTDSTSESSSRTISQGSSFTVETIESAVGEPSPTPFPFQEMTVPYLRTQEFESQIIDQELRSENANYSSYLASYDSDGLKIYGQLTIPKETTARSKPEEGWPAIVFIHGYIPPTTYRTFGNYEAYVDYLARNGFVVFKIDLRGHDQSEGEAGGGYYAGDYIIDTLHAYSALQSTEVVNPEAIGLWGHSMAGNVSLRTAVAKQDIPAIVIWAGAVYTYEDMREFGIDDNSYRPPSTTSQRSQRRQQLRDTHGDFDPQSDFWKQVVPTNYLNGMSTAVHLHHAVNDDVVSIEYSRNLAKILQDAGIEHELYEYQSGGHNINGASFNTAMQRTVEFYREKLR